jgi:hypothetical protein
MREPVMRPGVALVAPIVIENPVGPAVPAAFVAVTLIVLVAAVVGVPDSNPVVANVSPSGTFVAVQVIGVSPLAANCRE